MFIARSFSQKLYRRLTPRHNGARGLMVFLALAAAVAAGVVFPDASGGFNFWRLLMAPPLAFLALAYIAARGEGDLVDQANAEVKRQLSPIINLLEGQYPRLLELLAGKGWRKVTAQDGQEFTLSTLGGSWASTLVSCPGIHPTRDVSFLVSKAEVFFGAKALVDLPHVQDTLEGVHVDNAALNQAALKAYFALVDILRKKNGDAGPPGPTPLAAPVVQEPSPFQPLAKIESLAAQLARNTRPELGALTAALAAMVARVQAFAAVRPGALTQDDHLCQFLLPRLQAALEAAQALLAAPPAPDLNPAVGALVDALSGLVARVDRAVAGLEERALHGLAEDIRRAVAVSDHAVPALAPDKLPAP